jgi:hypothetical protein
MADTTAERYIQAVQVNPTIPAAYVVDLIAVTEALQAEHEHR